MQKLTEPAIRWYRDATSYLQTSTLLSGMELWYTGIMIVLITYFLNVICDIIYILAMFLILQQKICTHRNYSK